MICSKCGNNNVNVQMVTTKEKRKKGLTYWLLFGWLIDLLLWLFATAPRLIFAIFFSKKKINSTVAICQHCGNSWKVTNN